MNNTNWRFILINLFAVGILILSLLRNNRLEEFYKIALGILLPITIFVIVHYLILRKMLNMQFPFEPLMQKHRARIKIAAKTSDWVYKGQEMPNWAKHNYAATPYFFAFAITIFSLLIFVLLRLAINAYTSFDLKTSFDPRNIPEEKLKLGYYAFLASWYTIVLSNILIIFSQKIFDKPRSATTKGIIIAGLAALIAVLLYMLILFQIMPIQTSR